MSDNEIARKQILPMQNPPITSYHYQADLLSAILNNEKSKPWIYNRFIQLHIPDKNCESFKHFGFRLDFYTSFLWAACPFVNYQRVKNVIEK